MFKSMFKIFHTFFSWITINNFDHIFIWITIWAIRLIFFWLNTSHIGQKKLEFVWRTNQVFHLAGPFMELFLDRRTEFSFIIIFFWIQYITHLIVGQDWNLYAISSRISAFYLDWREGGNETICLYTYTEKKEIGLVLERVELLLGILFWMIIYTVLNRR